MHRRSAFAALVFACTLPRLAFGQTAPAPSPAPPPASASVPAPSVPAETYAPAPAPEADPGSFPEPLPPPAPAPKDDRSSSRDTLRVVGWIAIGVGAQATIIAVATSFMMLHQQSVRSDNCPTANRCNGDGIAANDSLQRMGGWNAGAWIVGAVGLIGGTFLVLSNPSNAGEKKKDDQPKPQGGQTAIGVTPNGAGASLVLRSTF